MRKGCFLLFLITIAQFTFAQQTSRSEIETDKIADGFQFVEGPVWKDNALLFSDIPANKIYKWKPGEEITTFLTPSGNSNGLALDLNGNLILAQHGPRQVARLEEDGTLTPLATHYNGKRLNSPNDLTIKSDGSIFFTDPVFGLNDQHGTPELTFQGVYRISPHGEVQRLDSLDLPNGIAFSPDESKLYVNESQKRIIYVYDVIDDSTLANKREFARIQPIGYADGMEMDASGNLYCSGPQGVWIFDSTGTNIGKITGMTANPSNCGWGDEDGKTLYITAGTAVYSYRPSTTGTSDILFDQNIDESFELFNNYPNPFNPSTNIAFYIAEAGNYTLKIYDALGEDISTLINEHLVPGSYSIMFNAPRLSTSIFFYELTGASKKVVKKMMLIK